MAEKVEPLRVKVRELEAVRGYLKEAWSSPLVYLNRSTLLSQDRATAQAVLRRKIAAVLGWPTKVAGGRLRAVGQVRCPCHSWRGTGARFSGSWAVSGYVPLRQAPTISRDFSGLALGRCLRDVGAAESRQTLPRQQRLNERESTKLVTGPRNQYQMQPSSGFMLVIRKEKNLVFLFLRPGI